MNNQRLFSIKLKSIFIFSLISLNACTTSSVSYTSKYIPSSLPSVKEANLSTSFPPIIWWKQFDDNLLDDIVNTAWSSNYDLRVASERLASTREGVFITAASRIPKFNIGSANEYKHLDGNSQFGSKIYGSIDLELDLFGRINHAVEAAKADENEQAHLLEETRRLVLSKVVNAYLELRYVQKLRRVISEQLENQKSMFTLINERVAAGRSSQLDSVRFEAQLRLIEARLPVLIAQERALRNRIATLTGIPLDATIISILDEPKELSVPKAILTDEPAQLLRRRPDVAAAERALYAAMSREQLSRIQLLPQVNISSLISGGKYIFNLFFIDSIIDGGAKFATIRASSAQARAAAVNYEKVIAVALEEADTAISDWIYSNQNFTKIATAHRLSIDSALIARIRYKEGVESLLSVLEAERTALTAHEKLIDAQRDLIMSISRAYVAIAGGFDQNDSIKLLQQPNQHKLGS